MSADDAATAPRRRRLPAHQRREQIVTAARALFAERGFEATTTREIAAAAGASDALLYRHFASKEDLLRAVVDAGIARFSDLGPPPHVDPGALPPRELLRRLGRGFLDALVDQLDLVVLLVSQQPRLDGDTRFVAFVDTAARRLGATLDPSDAERGHLLARSFMGSLVSFVLLQRHLGLDRVREVDADAYLATAVDATVAALPERAGTR